MQEKVYKKRIKDTDELRALILTAWDEMDQRIIDAAITCLHACIKAKGGHFELREPLVRVVMNHRV